MNLEEVAKRAKVSTATVSRVLNHAASVRTSTRNRVLKAVAELKYQPNLHARHLAGGRSRTLGVIVSNLANPFFFDVCQEIEARALAQGYDIVVANTDYDPERLVKSVRLMVGRRVAGLAALVSEMDPVLVQLLTDYQIPTVFYDVGPTTNTILNIRVNSYRGVEKVVDYLRSMGHRRLAFVGHHLGLGPISERQRAFLEVAGRYETAVELRTVANADSLEGGQMAARELLSSGFQPTAIVCVNDFMAVGVLRELRERGLRVPEDVSVTGFDNIKLSEFCSPALTTLHIPSDRIGALAFEHLTREAGAGAPAGSEVVLDPDFIVRDSTGRPSTVAG
jgi:DNA-binding LacI/PurR family transcriptional regulator